MLPYKISILGILRKLKKDFPVILLKCLSRHIEKSLCHKNVSSDAEEDKQRIRSLLIGRFMSFGDAFEVDLNVLKGSHRIPSMRD